MCLKPTARPRGCIWGLRGGMEFVYKPSRAGLRGYVEVGEVWSGTNLLRHSYEQAFVGVRQALGLGEAGIAHEAMKRAGQHNGESEFTAYMLHNCLI